MRKFAKLRNQVPAILFCLGLFLCVAAPPAHAEQSLEYQVKAAFLLNFTKFIEWPPDESAGPDSSFEICILGDDPFGTALDQMVEGETLRGRRMTVQRVRRPPPPSCRVLFIGKMEKDLASLMTDLAPGVLTVGDGPGFLRDGGMIAFLLDNNRVRFDINQSVAARAGLNISSKLLKVARSVEK